MADGSIEFSTKLDNSDLEKQLKDAEKKINSLKRKLETEETNKSFLEKQMDRAQKSIEAASAETERLRAKLDELKSVDPTSPDYFAAQSQIDSYTQRLAEAEKHEMELANSKYKLDQKWQSATDKIEVYRDQISAVTQRHARLAAEAKEAAEKSSTSYASAGERIRAKFASVASNIKANMSTTASSSANVWDGFASKITTMFKRVFVFGAILQGLRAVKNAISGALQQNLRYSAALAGLKAAMQGFAAGIAEVVGPAITAAVNMATAALTTLAKLVDVIFGTHIVAAIERARAAAEASWRQTDASRAAQDAANDAAQAANDQSKAAKKLAKAEDKAARSIMSFDELNVMQAKNADDAADALGDQADSVPTEGIADPSSLMNPDWDAFDVGKIDAKLSELMVILGAALMAVGAILCFSGINIPLGISLMAIGALMVYTAYQEQWDKLPQEVRDAISGVLVITGVVLLVLGAILAFSGINVALGIGMMAAGAILLYTAAALNWDYMSVQMEVAITTVATIVGGALLVLGAILAFTGWNVPLGIGLIAVGAVALAGVAALNWDYISTHINDVITIVVASLSVALLVIGAVLVFSGAHPVLGLGLLAAGAVGLGKTAIENWDYIKSNLDEVLPVIELVVSSALLVIGAALLFSGTATPLGFGLLGAGAVGLAVALVENWNKIPDKIKSIVATIEAVVGTALLVLGAVLTFSGVNIALGLALLAAGALLLAHIAAVSWKEIPNNVREAVTNIASIAGAALLVLGIILTLTGVAAPLGIALIAAGAASFVAVAALNWNFIQEKVKGVWDAIVSWWNSGPAKVFTQEWWSNLFKSMINGLIYQINNGLSAFSGFINSIAGSVIDILNFFGVSGWSFSLGIPHIPYLAEGAVIPPNRKFMAVLGDQKHGNNIETPEGLMRQVVREETGSMLADVMMTLSQGGETQRDVVLMVGHTELARATVRGMRDLSSSGELGGLGITLA